MASLVLDTNDLECHFDALCGLIRKYLAVSQFFLYNVHEFLPPCLSLIECLRESWDGESGILINVFIEYVVIDGEGFSDVRGDVRELQTTAESFFADAGQTIRNIDGP